ncbi:MAG: pilus assembly protein PilM [Chitinispirillaceae bacterium]|nr:pilus assembly protein PilM [Chitinispirillaceae bacterium]
MAKTLITSIGIEHDAMSIRAVKLTIIRSGSKMSVKVMGLSELYGDFSNDDNISGGMKKIKEKISVSQSDRVATCLAGKQVYVAQIPFKKLADDEMKGALRIEIKKSLPFEVAGASIDYQLIEGTKKDDVHQFVVTAVPSILLTRHLNMMERLGIRPYIVDVLPLAIANAFHLSQQSCAMGLAYIIVHVGPAVTNLIICGDESVMFFHRSIYFLADEVFGADREAQFTGEALERKLMELTEEISRSISFYEKTYSVKNFAGVFLLGEYLESGEIHDAIAARTNLTVEVIDVFSTLKQSSNAPKGKFEVAMALAMRNAQQ